MNQQQGPWTKELDSFVRAFSGAFLFGMPFVFTMELWWLGRNEQLWKLLTLFGLAFLANLALTYFGGFKRQSTFSTTLDQAVDAMAVGIVAAALLLWSLNRIHLSDPLDSVLGRIIIESVPLSIGASVANVMLGGTGQSRTGGQKPSSSVWRATLNDVGATIAGAIFISFSIAPTREVPTLAARLDLFGELLVVVLTLLITYAIVFESGFDPEQAKSGGYQGLFQHPLPETVIAYILSLLVSLLVLYLFDQVHFGEPPASVLSQVVVLGLPAAVGGAAGRVVI